MASNLSSVENSLVVPFQNNDLFDPPRLSQNDAANGDDRGRKGMEWFSQKTSIAGTQIPNWVLVLAVVIVLFLIYRIIT
jgi:hypothetical protein